MSEKVIINWKKDKAGILVVPCLAGGKVIKHLRLLPGYNTVPKKDWEQARKHTERFIISGDLEEVLKSKPLPSDEAPSIEKKVKKGIRNAPSDKKKEEDSNPYVTSLKELPADSARDIILDTWDISTLEEWLKEEGRNEIRAVIAEQIMRIQKPPTVKANG